MNNLFNWVGQHSRIQNQTPQPKEKKLWVNIPEWWVNIKQNGGSTWSRTYIQPAKPNQNAYIERFNRTYRDEVLNVFAFDNLNQARLATQAWMWVYNNERPHSSLAYLTATLFLLKYGKLHQPLGGGVEFQTRIHPDLLLLVR